MREENKKYNEWLNAVKSQQPVLSNPEGLTTDIMKEISNIKKPKGYFGTFVRWASGIAAIILTCFFISEAMPVAIPAQSANSKPIWEVEDVTTILPSNWQKMTLSEKGDYLSAYQRKLEKQKGFIHENIQKQLSKTKTHEYE